MGIYDRDYYRKDHGGRNPVFSVFDSAIATLIAANVLVWVLQLAGGDKVTDLLAASGRDVFELRLWKLFTANFAHSTDGIWHLVGNMLFLYFFGRELEQIYGRRDFYTLYLSAGILAVLAEVTLHHFAPGEDDFRVLGASGAVMAIVVVFTLFYPQRLIYFFFFVPLPAWILCIIFLLLDLAGLTSRSGRGIANLAHLTGATVGFLYWFFDLRWDGLMRRLPSREKSRRRRGKILQPGAVFKEARQKIEHDSVSRRIDELLQKIHEKKELSEEELTFLKENSGRYRSRD